MSHERMRVNALDRLFVGTVAVALVVQSMTGALGSTPVTIVACVAMLLLGLPHGTLDLQLIKRQWGAAAVAARAVLALYLGLAAATWWFWSVDPVLALGAFVAVAVVHFAEDWSATGSRFLAHSLSLATLASPSLLWRGDMRDLFVAVAGDPQAGALAELLLLVAPVSLLVAAVALAASWREGNRREAVCGAAVLGGMVLLPPAVGFTLFFCLFHSPRHFRAGLQELRWPRFAQWRLVVGTLTMAALAIAVAVLTIEARDAVATGVVAASFMTLSILTVPHMLIPTIVAALSRRRPVTRPGPPPRTAAVL